MSVVGPTSLPLLISSLADFELLAPTCISWTLTCWSLKLCTLSFFLFLYGFFFCTLVLSFFFFSLFFLLQNTPNICNLYLRFNFYKHWCWVENHVIQLINYLFISATSTFTFITFWIWSLPNYRVIRCSKASNLICTFLFYCSSWFSTLGFTPPFIYSTFTSTIPN